ncbi:MAG: dienelactone hydrolase family protein [Kiritimatiellia bacterium]|nr:prolyl oligopeptidase family serine peptidase [Lentisphaerota bacterium]
MQNTSFTGFLEDFGRMFPPAMIYREGEDFRQWQQRFYDVVDGLRGPLPPRTDLRTELRASIEEDGYTRHVLRIAVTEITTLTAYLLVPHGLQPGEKRPGLLVSHGHANYGIDSICGVRELDKGPEAVQRAYAMHAVRAGYVVLAPSWWGWVDRDGHTDRCGPGEDKCNKIQMAASMYGLSVLALHMQDGQAALDVLAARPEVDAKRIGCIGNSYGGRTTMWLTVFDKRIRAAVAAGCMNTFRERSLKLASCGIQYFPGILRYGDVKEVFSLIAPRPLQLQAGALDRLVTPSDRDDIAVTVRQAYQSLQAEDQLDYILHEQGHILLWELAEPFLRRHLG